MDVTFAIPISSRDTDISVDSDPLSWLNRCFLGDDSNRSLQFLHRVNGAECSGFSPVFIYGLPGVGKNVLAQVLADRFLARSDVDRRTVTDRSPLTIASADLDRRVRHALLIDQIDDLLDQYEAASCLTIDRIDEFKGSDVVDNSLARVIDRRTAAGRLTILLSQVAPWELTSCSLRLRSRLSQGWVVELRPPGTAALGRLLDDLLAVRKREISPAARKWLLHLPGLTLPQLISFFDRADRDNPRCPRLEVDHFQSAHPAGGAMDQKAIRQVLGLVARHFRIKQADMIGPSRRRSLVRARGIAIVLLRDIGLTWQKIAESIGKRDHSTVIHAHAKTISETESDSQAAQTISQLRQTLIRHRSAPS